MSAEESDHHPERPPIKINAETKEERYKQLLPDFDGYIFDEHEEVSVLANAAAILKDVFDFFWVGFYIVKDGKLILGPFQGPAACYSIKFGKGVCGSAWEQKKTLVVPDVEKFPGHIACSSLSRSEIVVPIFAGDEVKAVLDIDSKELGTFDETDKIYLEKIVEMISKNVYA